LFPPAGAIAEAGESSAEVVTAGAADPLGTSILAPAPSPGGRLEAPRSGPAAGAVGGDGAASSPGARVEAPGAEAGPCEGEPTGGASGTLVSGGPEYEPGIIAYPPGPPGTGKSSHSSQNVAQPAQPVASATTSTASRSLAMT
jgi:hypothetical protein